MNSASTPLSGRRAEAARNDQRILDAARAVFDADPGAPIAAVAEQAGVGISALYRRYASKEELLRRLCGDSLKVYIAAAIEALADDGDPWEAFALVFEQVASVRLGDEGRTRQLRHRYLALLLEAVHAPAATPLPGPPPSWQELTARW
jgi:AcrR family transcriptional regulator